jgi:putative transposase
LKRKVIAGEAKQVQIELETIVEIILQRAKEKVPDARPGIISDNGPQFIAKDFKEFIRVSGVTHVETAPYYPQSNGKIERWHGTLKRECIRLSTPLSLDDATLRGPHQSRYFLDRCGWPRPPHPTRIRD